MHTYICILRWSEPWKFNDYITKNQWNPLRCYSCHHSIAGLHFTTYIFTYIYKNIHTHRYTHTHMLFMSPLHYWIALNMYISARTYKYICTYTYMHMDTRTYWARRALCKNQANEVCSLLSTYVHINTCINVPSGASPLQKPSQWSLLQPLQHEQPWAHPVQQHASLGMYACWGHPVTRNF